MDTATADDEDTYKLLFIVGAIILAFSLILNVYFIVKATFL